MKITARLQQAWPYVWNTILFAVVVPPAMVLTATLLQLAGRYMLSFEDFIIHEAKQAYLISAFVGIPLSMLHTYLLRHAHMDSGRPTVWRSTWYVTLLGFLTTLSLLRFLPLGYDGVFYIVPGVIVYGAAVGKLAGVNSERPSERLATAPQKPSVWRYLLNAVLFGLIATVVITAGLWTALKTEVIGGLWAASPFFLFLLAVVSSLLHTFLLGEIATAPAGTMRRRSVGLAGGLAILASAAYVFLGNVEFILFVAAALIYGWSIGRLVGKSQAAPTGKVLS